MPLYSKEKFLNSGPNLLLLYPFLSASVFTSYQHWFIFLKYCFRLFPCLLKAFGYPQLSIKSNSLTWHSRPAMAHSPSPDIFHGASPCSCWTSFKLLLDSEYSLHFLCPWCSLCLRLSPSSYPVLSYPVNTCIKY